MVLFITIQKCMLQNWILQENIHWKQLINYKQYKKCTIHNWILHEKMHKKQLRKVWVNFHVANMGRNMGRKENPMKI